MSYIAQLQEQRQRPSGLGALAIGVGALAGGLDQARVAGEDRQRKLEDHLREVAEGRVKAFQVAGQSMVDSGNTAGARALLPDFTQNFNRAYGTNLTAPTIHGSPVMAQGREKVEPLGPPTAPGKLLPPVEVDAPYTYEAGRTFDNPEQQAAIRGGLLLPPDKLGERNPEHDVYNTRTGAVVSKGAPAPYRMPYELAAELKRLGYATQGEIAGRRITSAEKIAGGHDATSILNNTTTNATRVTTTGMNNTTSIANAATAAKAASDRAAATAAAKAAAAEAKRNAAAAAAMAKKVQASGIIAEDMAKKFPWAGVQGVDPSTGDIIISAPVGALSPRNERLLMDYMPGTTVLGKGRIMVTGTPDLAHLRAKVKPPKAAPAPKPPKPFDADKARKNVMASMGLRPSQRIRPDQQGRYDTLMQQERDAYNRTQNGGKTALQMLLEMPD